MITLERTITVPADRRVVFDLPESVPEGVVSVVLMLSVKKNSVSTAETVNPLYVPESFPRIDELKAEARRKHAERFKDGHDAMQRFRGCLKDIFPEDGVVYQRHWHEEWDREWE